ncbi:MAG: N-acetylglucosamine kinase, partial [Cyanobium sp. LacPavin_0920_WC12_MAG_62_9]|nr:N-acetylglucosamine kinase [Cyanobium sp. LacPavin_0920_WC12_MAG_62_9]
MAEPQAAAPGVIAGFDAGQTHTTCRLALVSSGQVVGEGQGPGVCHLAAPQGPERFAAALRQSLENASRQGHGQPGAGAFTLLAAGIGASGIEAGSPLQAQGRAIAAAALNLAPNRVAVTGDERTALRGAMGGGAGSGSGDGRGRGGIVVISGTGTIAVGRNGAGQEHRCSGWGWLVDGAGSAMDIGRDGLALSLQMADGRRPDGPLRPKLWQALGLEASEPASTQALTALVVEPGFGAAGFARLAPVVAELAMAGDPDCQAFVERSSQALAAMSDTIANQLQLTATLVWTIGGALAQL